MNKKMQLGNTLLLVEGYAIRTILTNKREDTGKIGVFAGKKLVSKELANSQNNINSLQNWIISNTKPIKYINNNIKMLSRYSLSKKKYKHTVIDDDDVILYSGYDEKAAKKYSKRK